VVQENPATADVICRHLQQAGYETTAASTGEDALGRAQAHHPDVVILDVVLPDIDGLEVMRCLRRRNGRRETIVLLLGRGDERDRVAGLRLGADDYVVKPFSPRELVARVNALARRLHSTTPREPPLEFDRLKIDPAARTVDLDGRPIELTQREFDLLLFLARHPGEAFTRDQLMEQVWHYTFYLDTSTVTVHIRRLRAKVEPEPARPRYIETVWGVGYRFAP
jgi:DNA-binding response OmpR family regulator